MIMAPKMQVLPDTAFGGQTRHVNASFREDTMFILQLVSGAVICSALGAMIAGYLLIMGSILLFGLVMIASRGATFAKSRNETDMRQIVAS
jgi:hypothetical protein